MKAAHQADTSTLKGMILSLARAHAGWLDCNLDIGLKKEQCGINNGATGCLFLPLMHIPEYLVDHEV